MDSKASRGRWSFVSGLLKSEFKEMKKRPSILLSECNSPKMMLKSIYGRGRSLDRAECGFRSKSFEEESRRIGREKRCQKYDLAEERREDFRAQIRQKYGIKSKEESVLKKNFSKCPERDTRSLTSADIIKSKGDSFNKWKLDNNVKGN